MLIGIVIQMGKCQLKFTYLIFLILYCKVAISFYVLLASEFFLRFKYQRPVRTKAYLAVDPSRRQINKKMKWMLIGLSFSTVCIFIRYGSALICTKGNHSRPK